MGHPPGESDVRQPPAHAELARRIGRAQPGGTGLQLQQLGGASDCADQDQPVCTPADRSVVATFGWTTSVMPSTSGSAWTPVGGPRWDSTGAR